MENKRVVVKARFRKQTCPRGFEKSKGQDAQFPMLTKAVAAYIPYFDAETHTVSISASKEEEASGESLTPWAQV